MKREKKFRESDYQLASVNFDKKKKQVIFRAIGGWEIRLGKSGLQIVKDHLKMLEK